MDNETLYRLYSEENHRYNTLIWQFPTALLAVNLLAIEKVEESVALLLGMWVLNMALLLCVAKHAFHQKCFTKALTSMLDEFKKKNKDLHVPDFTKRGFFRIPATTFMVWTLILLNQSYLLGVVLKLANA